MLSKVKTLTDYRLLSLDGEIGKVKEFYFDDRYWTIRYLVADTGSWLSSRQVLISPYSLIAVKNTEKEISVNITKQQVEDSPSIDTDKPVSRQFEESYYGYYGLPGYWTGQNVWGSYPYIVQDPTARSDFADQARTWNPDLRSTDDVRGYHIEGTDGEVGHVEDYILDDQNWTIRYLVVDTKNWLPGELVLISPEWVEDISWGESKISVKLTRESIKASPKYSPEDLINRDYETAIHRHYDRKGYWVDPPKATTFML